MGKPYFVRSLLKRNDDFWKIILHHKWYHLKRRFYKLYCRHNDISKENEFGWQGENRRGWPEHIQCVKCGKRWDGVL